MLQSKKYLAKQRDHQAGHRGHNDVRHGVTGVLQLIGVKQCNERRRQRNFVELLRVPEQRGVEERRHAACEHEA